MTWFAKLTLFSLVALALPFGPAHASRPVCEGFAEAAALEEGVPQGLLSAIALTESGRSAEGAFRAWPWTLNVGGKGFYFASRDAAEAKIHELLAKGVTNFDVGCMQVNFRWHGEAFAHATDMLDPRQNTVYAARFLSELRGREGSWEKATQAYHSLTPELGSKYLERVRANLAHVGKVAPEKTEEKPWSYASNDATQGGALIALGEVSTVAVVLPEGAHPRFESKRRLRVRLPQVPPGLLDAMEASRG